MPCGCSEGVCSCFVNDSNTVSVSGSGAGGNPYFLSVIADGDGGLTTGIDGVGILLDPDPCNLATLSGAGLLVKVHTANTGNVTFTGCGTATDPIVGTVVIGPGGIASFEAGMMMPWPGVGAPPVGWKLIDTGVYDGDDPAYAPLYAVLGKKWGDQGAGGNFFCLPPTPGRTMVGAGTGAGEDNAGGPNVYPNGTPLATRIAGEWFGSQDVALAPSNLAPHFHSGASHTHDYSHAHGATSAESPKVAWSDTAKFDGGNPGADSGTLQSSIGNCSGSVPVADTEYRFVAARDAATGATGLGNVRAEGACHAHSTNPIGPINTSGATYTDNGGDGSATSGLAALPHQNIQPSLVIDWMIFLG